MERLIKEIESMLNENHDYANLFMALSMIDICAKIEFPNMKKQSINGISYNNYMKWLDEFYIPLYERDVKDPIINSNDIYSLRCKVCHEGTLNIGNNNLSSVILSKGHSHRNVCTVSNGKVVIIQKQLNIDMFIKEIINAIKLWLSKTSKNVILDFDIQVGKFSSANLDGLQVFHNIE